MLKVHAQHCVLSTQNQKKGVGVALDVPSKPPRPYYFQRFQCLRDEMNPQDYFFGAGRRTDDEAVCEPRIRCTRPL